MNSTAKPIPMPFVARQAGASLLFALITLVALALAATALVRSVDTGAIVLGNLGAKKATSIAADRATQLAIRFLVNKGIETNRYVDDANNGYYSSAKDDFDITGFGGVDATRKLINWEVDGSCAYATAGGVCDATTRPSDAQVIDSAAGLNARWVITRLCSLPGVAHTDTANNCVMPPKVGFRTSESKGGKDFSNVEFKVDVSAPFYRIVVRVTGPRNAVTYTETIVNLPQS
jgi:type IV pilus assembly protein PilX